MTLPSFRFSPWTPLRNLRRTACSTIGILCSAADDANAAWDQAKDGAEVGEDGEIVKEGGKDAANEILDNLPGTETTKQNSRDIRVKTLPDGSRVISRPSTDGRWTLERHSPNQRGHAGPNRIIRFKE